jgi:hypothetical protein
VIDRFRAVLLALSLSAMFGGCGQPAEPSPQAPPAGSAPRPAHPPSASPVPNPPTTQEPVDDFEGTIGIVSRERPSAPVAVLRSVRTATHEGFDRVVFEFEGDRVPGYHVEYVDKPVRACGSGEPVSVAGDAWLLVRLVPAQAHDDDGKATVDERDRRLQFPVLRQLRAVCDFEADVTWVLGVAAPNRYRVLELASPARLVVDVKQSGR